MTSRTLTGAKLEVSHFTNDFSIKQSLSNLLTLCFLQARIENYFFNILGRFNIKYQKFQEAIFLGEPESKPVFPLVYKTVAFIEICSYAISLSRKTFTRSFPFRVIFNLPFFKIKPLLLKACRQRSLEECLHFFGRRYNSNPPFFRKNIPIFLRNFPIFKNCPTRQQRFDSCRTNPSSLFLRINNSFFIITY